MIRSLVKLPLDIIRKIVKQNRDNFLKNVSGVVHVGANIGQEKDIYRHYKLDVIWIEPIPQIFGRLSDNIKNYKNQRALQALITDTDGKEYEFNVASNNGASSSILKFKKHKEVWPNVGFVSTIKLTSVTLATLFRRESINPIDYQALIMDTQGSELLVLKGSVSILKNFSFIKTEVPDFESYEGCCQLSDMEDFMREHGYKEYSRRKFASRKSGGKLL